LFSSIHTIIQIVKGILANFRAIASKSLYLKPVKGECPFVLRSPSGRLEACGHSYSLLKKVEILRIYKSSPFETLRSSSSALRANGGSNRKIIKALIVSKLDAIALGEF